MALLAALGLMIFTKGTTLEFGLKKTRLKDYSAYGGRLGSFASLNPRCISVN